MKTICLNEGRLSGSRDQHWRETGERDRARESRERVRHNAVTYGVNEFPEALRNDVWRQRREHSFRGTERRLLERANEDEPKERAIESDSERERVCVCVRREREREQNGIDGAARQEATRSDLIGQLLKGQAADHQLVEDSAKVVHVDRFGIRLRKGNEG